MKAALVLMLAAPSPVPPTVAAPAVSGSGFLTVSPTLSAPSLALTLTPVLHAAAVEVPDGAFSEKRQEAAKAVQHAHAEIPVVDYLKRAFDESSAKEFMDGEFTFDGATKKTGRELLSYLVTPDALSDGLTPDPARVDFNRLGKTSSQIRETVDAEGVPYHLYERVLGGAFREGLIYRLYNSLTGFTYHGVPHEIRAIFGLEAPAEQKPAEIAKKSGPTPFSEALTALSEEAVGLDDPELFEFTAQTVAAAIKAGKLSSDAVSPAFKARAAKIDFDAPSLKDAALTLAESAEGTPWESKTAALLALLD